MLQYTLTSDAAMNPHRVQPQHFWLKPFWPQAGCYFYSSHMAASVDATLDNWAVGNHADLLGEILDVMVCRRAVDKQDGGGTLDVPWMQHIVTRPPNIQFVFPSYEGKRAYEAKGVLTKGDIISSMQLN